MAEQSRVLVVGSGYLAGHIGQRLCDAGHTVTLSSRRRPSTPETRSLDWVAVDVTDGDHVRALLDATRPDAVVTAHGPSDITWCEANRNEALIAHRDGAHHLADVLDGRRVLMISTDNVFPGRKDSYAESDPTEPANAYGRAKLAAEDGLLRTGNALVLRVSLVYGWDRAGLRPNFFTMCADRVAAGQPVTVPEDHWNTPVLVDDVAAWTAALLGSEHTGVVHLGGPRGTSRVAWARRIAEGLGADPDLVRTVPRRTTTYACRPRNACLHSERAQRIRELDGLEPMDVFEACTKLIALEGTDCD